VSPTLASGESEEELASPMTLHETHPHRMRCRLERWQTEVTVAPTAHGAVYRFDFPPTNTARLVINVRRKIGMRECSSDAVLTRNADACWGGGTYSGNWNPAPYGRLSSDGVCRGGCQSFQPLLADDVRFRHDGVRL